MYRQEHLKDLNTIGIAELVSSMLYGKRFFPYYVSTIVSGFDEDGGISGFGRFWSIRILWLEILTRFWKI